MIAYVVCVLALHHTRSPLVKDISTLIMGMILGVLIVWWLHDTANTKALQNDLDHVVGRGLAAQQRLEALEGHFKVGPYATKKDNVWIGMQCSSCDKEYTITLINDEPPQVSVCPGCFKVG